MVACQVGKLGRYRVRWSEADGFSWLDASGLWKCVNSEPIGLRVGGELWLFPSYSVQVVSVLAARNAGECLEDGNGWLELCAISPGLYWASRMRSGGCRSSIPLEAIDGAPADYLDGGQ